MTDVTASSDASTGQGTPNNRQLGQRQLVLALAVFWGVVAASSLAFGWESIREHPFSAWRTLLTDTAGAGLGYGIARLLQLNRTRPMIARAGLAMAYSLLGTFIYVITGLLLIIPLVPFALDNNVAVQIVRMVSANYWIFIAWSALFLVLDTGGSAAAWRRSTASAREQQRAQLQLADAARRLMPQQVSYAGLDAKWFWSFQGVFWGLMLVFEIANMINYGEDPTESWRLVLIQIVGVAVTAGMHFCALRPSRAAGLVKRAAIAIGLSLFAVSIFVFATWAAWFVIAPVEIYSNGEPLDTGWTYLARAAPRWAFLNFPIFVGWSGFYLALDVARRARKQETQLYNSIMLAQEAQLKMLRFQLNPHFLFNTLNAISTLVMDDRNEEAESMLVRLSRFLRFALDATPDDRVCLRDELDAQRLYLEIERARFAERLDVHIEADEAILDAQVPSLILQPVVENAIKYGVSRSSERVHVEIRARRDDDTLLLDVVDDGPGVDGPEAPGGTGLGLANIRSRLNVLYGARAELTAGGHEPRGYRVQLRLPYEIRRPSTQEEV